VDSTLASWNAASADEALAAMMACCGARRWAEAMVALRPIAGIEELCDAGDSIWSTMKEADWHEAFACHPRIGERKTIHAPAQSAAWSQEEQSSARRATVRVLAQLAVGNAGYEKRFGFTYIVCATGKSAEEMLAILNRRLANDPATELREAAEQQRQIMQIRLRKWIAR
jgi:2-oxo-4-hydroxy-4-carboxy-5-ureidoimidazoline decarboxylase